MFNFLKSLCRAIASFEHAPTYTPSGMKKGSGAITAAVIGAGASWYMSEQQEVPEFSMPDREEPSGAYLDVQRMFKETGTDLFAGDMEAIPEYLKPVGEIGGKTFENYLGAVKGDISKSVGENLARRGVTGGGASEAIARAMGNLTPKLRYQDLLKGIQGRQWLFGQGSNLLSSVKASEEGQRREADSFNLQRAQQEMQMEQLRYQMEQQQMQNTIDAAIAGGQAVGGIAGSLGSAGAGSANVGASSFSQGGLTTAQQNYPLLTMGTAQSPSSTANMDLLQGNILLR